MIMIKTMHYQKVFYPAVILEIVTIKIHVSKLSSEKLISMILRSTCCEIENISMLIGWKTD